MASDDIVPVFPKVIIAGGESTLIVNDGPTATVSMRETASNIRNYPTVVPPPADGKLSLLALTPGLEKAGLSPQAMPASWTSLRVLAFAGLVLKQRRWLEQYQREVMLEQEQAQQQRAKEYKKELLKYLNELIEMRMEISSKVTEISTC